MASRGAIDRGTQARQAGRGTSEGVRTKTAVRRSRSLLVNNAEIRVEMDTGERNISEHLAETLTQRFNQNIGTRKYLLNIAKQGPGKATQNNIEAAGTYFTKPRTSIISGPGTHVPCK